MYWTGFNGESRVAVLNEFLKISQIHQTQKCYEDSPSRVHGDIKHIERLQWQKSVSPGFGWMKMLFRISPTVEWLGQRKISREEGNGWTEVHGPFFLLHKIIHITTKLPHMLQLINA